jgi:hypothetical protein
MSWGIRYLFTDIAAMAEPHLKIAELANNL